MNYYIFFKENELTKLELDWWSKYYASTKEEGDADKCKKYKALGYDSIEVILC